VRALVIFALGLAACTSFEPVEEPGSTSSNITGEQVSPNRIANLAKEAGVRCEGIVLATAVALGESDGVVRAIHNNADSVDRGIWQINSKYWPMYSESCVYDPACNAGAMADISSNGASWVPWLAYTNGRYKEFMSQAQAGYDAGVTGCNGGSAKPSAPPAATAACESIGYYGLCVHSVSVWVEDGQCRVRDCAAEGKACGIISEEAGAGCLGGTAGAKVSDCSSYGSKGKCLGKTRVWSENGQCRWDANTTTCP